MDIQTFPVLRSPLGQEAIRAAQALFPTEYAFLQHYQTLCRTYPPDLARVALETAIYRAEATNKFGERAAQMYFTREAMEQATPDEVSAHHAQRFSGAHHILDLGCSIGGDTHHLAQYALTIGLDRDPLRLHLARANVPGAEFALADLTSPLPFASAHHTALFFDPARRNNGRRAFSIHHYTPPLDIVRTWLPHFPALGVKISPGVKREELAEYDAEVEFVSLSGDLKEAILWFGPLKRGTWRATLLPTGDTLIGDPTLPAPIATEPGAYLYEPDAAVIRAGLVTTLAQQLDASLLDSTIAYLTSDTAHITPFARRWQVEAWMPFHLKKLRAALRKRGVGRVTVKKRGSPLQPEQLIRDLRLKKGEEERILVLTRVQRQHSVLICSPLL